MQLRAYLRPNAQSTVIAIPAALILAAWTALLTLQQQQSPLGSLLGHGGGHTHSGESLQVMNHLSVAAFAASWTVMILAMMLPTALPFIARFAAGQQSCGHEPWQRWQHPLWTVLLFVVGYVSVWLLFGLIADRAYRGLQDVQQFIGHTIGTHASPNVIVQATLVIAGLYQFTPAKRHSIGGSCAWGRMLAGHWLDGARGISPFLLGTRYGWQCLGGCWALMLLMFAGGAHNVALMLGLGAIMAAEKNTVWAARLSRLLGIFLIGIAIMWVWADAQGVLIQNMHAHG